MINTNLKVNQRNKKKKINLVTIALTLLFIVSFMMLINTFGNMDSYGDGEREFISITIEPGDSLWSISDEHTPSHRDLRETMSIIRRYNELESDLLFVGESLYVPKIY